MTEQLPRNAIENLQNLCQYIIGKPLNPDWHESYGIKGVNFWCNDWWHIEVLKFLFNGEPMYLEDPPPNRLKNNDNFSKEKIIVDGIHKLNMFEKLMLNKDFSDNLLICECGWGIDLALSIAVKKWEKITCYDNNEFTIDYSNSYWQRLGLPIKWINSTSDLFKFSEIIEPTILIGNNIHFRDGLKEEIQSNKNIFNIINGEIS